MTNIRNFPTWDALYKNAIVEELPWYSKELDKDLENELSARKISNGTFLDIGTGPGTQAAKLANLGFNVTATDLSKNAVIQAKKISNKVRFIQDDITTSKLPSNSFDYIFDRGCFHTLSKSLWQAYISTIKRILKDDGILFLKTFSIKEKALTQGPYRFSEIEIKNIFEKDFQIESTKETVFQGTLSEQPKALFIVLKKR